MKYNEQHLEDQIKLRVNQKILHDKFLNSDTNPDESFEQWAAKRGRIEDLTLRDLHAVKPKLRTCFTSVKYSFDKEASVCSLSMKIFDSNN